MNFKELFFNAVNNYSEKCAVKYENKSITYEQLMTEIMNISSILYKYKKIPSVIVILLSNNYTALKFILSALVLNITFVPVDVNLPEKRINYMINDCNADCIICDNYTKNRAIYPNIEIINIDKLPKFFDDKSKYILADTYKEDFIAYIIYTSGSTGNPKGVQILHSSLVNLLTSMRIKPGINENDILLSITTICFDICLLELLLPIITGACLVIMPKKYCANAKYISKTIINEHITIFQGTPSTWNLMMEFNLTNKNLKALCGGEKLSSSLAKKIYKNCASLWNMYGPTETTIWSFVSNIKNEDITLGDPINNTEYIVVDDNNKIIQSGIGELYISGKGLSIGYTNPKENDNRFTVIKNTRYFKTGDIVKIESNKLYFCNRKDSQIKLNGYRIELGEIEEAISNLNGVELCCAIFNDSIQNNKFIMAFVQLSQSYSNNLSEYDIKLHLFKTIPKYMIPKKIIILKEMPLTFNKKINKKSLKEKYMIGKGIAYEK